MAKWNIKPVDPKLISKLQKEFHVPEIIARLLAHRDIHSLEDSSPFFTPSIDQLHDPFIMLNMEKAAEEVIRQVENGRRIVVFGDYDVDGTTAASMLYLFLRSIGAEVSVFIPDRQKQGYGLSRHGIDFAVENDAQLLITCDCGINALESVDYANETGVRVIITDHHTPDDTLPNAFAILNPKQRGCTYPFKGLCGGGVSFKLASAIARLLGLDMEMINRHLDLITLGTAADIVPIVDENRIIVTHGLRRLQDTDKPGIKALFDLSGMSNKEPTVGRLIFWVAPKINAAGRMGDALRAVRLLTSEDSSEAVGLAQELDRENRSRQAIQKAIMDEAFLKVNAEVNLELDRAIVLWKENWQPGVIGIVASKIREEFNRPTVIISVDGDSGKGSARSMRGFDLYENLSKCAHLLDEFGGHPMAAGLNILAGNLEKFRQAFIHLANESLTSDDLVDTLDIDGEMELNVIDGQLMDFLKKLAPYGPGNRRPQFVSRNIEVSGSPRLVGNGDHLKFTAKQNGVRYDSIGFNLGKYYERLITGNKVDLAYVVEENEWRGEKTIQLNIRDINPVQE